MNNGELGDSAGGSRRIDMVKGLKVDARAKTWRSGFNVDGME